MLGGRLTWLALCAATVAACVEDTGPTGGSYDALCEEGAERECPRCRSGVCKYDGDCVTVTQRCIGGRWGQCDCPEQCVDETRLRQAQPLSEPSDASVPAVDRSGEQTSFDEPLRVAIHELSIELSDDSVGLPLTGFDLDAQSSIADLAHCVSSFASRCDPRHSALHDGPGGIDNVVGQTWASAWSGGGIDILEETTNAYLSGTFGVVIELLPEGDRLQGRLHRGRIGGMLPSWQGGDIWQPTNAAPAVTPDAEPIIDGHWVGRFSGTFYLPVGWRGELFDLALEDPIVRLSLETGRVTGTLAGAISQEEMRRFDRRLLGYAVGDCRVQERVGDLTATDLRKGYENGDNTQPCTHLSFAVDFAATPFEALGSPVPELEPFNCEEAASP